ncbi:MAG: serine/threonine protein phosphatase [Halioglobus sp.]|nr:serine/threonine protein phosphatase [Halioglobus sp.]|tara:strand:+ start:55 stop:1365 length:1311 start_codon:yes stop_codon:yes gene_type:complete
MRLLALFIVVLNLAACAAAPPPAPAPFSIAVIPDTQNMVSYKHQRGEGFALDGSVQFLQQMDTIAGWRDANGAPLAFVVGVGDVWQHQSLEMDAEHRARGFQRIPNPYFDSELAVTDRVLSEEIPLAVAGYSKLDAAGIPFGVAPGNHDHDAMWSAAGYPPQLDIAPQAIRMLPEHLGMLHIGGLDNFRSAFGADSDFFAGRDWYVASTNGGGSSAQTFRAGGYTFLHIALEMQPSDEVIAWAHGVIDAHPGVPTIVSTHDYLNTAGERLPNPIVDLALVDPEQHNSAQQLWDKLLSRRDEIFLVLCGHQHAQSRRVDANVNGFAVHQVLADYQGRGQSGLDAGQPIDPRRRMPTGLGDGWFRLMEFDLAADTPVIRVRTYSSHYRAYAGEVPQYAPWYKRWEQPQLSDEAFLAGDEFDLPLADFRARFGPAASAD